MLELTNLSANKNQYVFDAEKTNDYRAAPFDSRLA